MNEGTVAARDANASEQGISQISLPEPAARDDLTIVVAGQGGDGSLTTIGLLLNALTERGLYIFRQNNIASRIKGGHAAAAFRVSETNWGCLGDNVDLLLAFDAEAIQKIAPDLADGAMVVYDESREDISRDLLPPGARVFGLPLSRLSVRDLRRDMFKNCLGFGFVARLLGISDDEAMSCLKERFKRLSSIDLDHNIRALQLGWSFASDSGLSSDRCVWSLPTQKKSQGLLMTGNEAVAFGFLCAGGRFFAGYPITPATDIMDWLNRYADPFGGITLQAEDELAAVNMAVGASLAGVRAMTASSGPGIALMQETLSQAGSAEIPLVIVNCQRAGPSTGMPTKVEQSDIGMMTTGGNGDFPRVVLAPGNAQECFEHGVLATNFSQYAQCPIYIALDGVSQSVRTSAPLNLQRAAIGETKTLTSDDVAKMSAYKRYAITEDGISPIAFPGTIDAQNLVTGNERNEWGLVSTEPANRNRMIEKRARKIESIRAQLPTADEFGDLDSQWGVIGVGMIGAVMEEAHDRLKDMGINIAFHRPQTLWPILDDTLAFLKSRQNIIVIEMNNEGQLKRLLHSSGAVAGKLESILKYDGVPFTAHEIVEKICAIRSAS